MLKIELPTDAMYETACREFLTGVANKLKMGKDDLDAISFYVERKYRVALPSKTSNLELLRHIIMGFIANADLPAQSVEDIGLAIDEACTNIIKHSYGDNQRGIIDVSVEIARDHIEISVVDTGEKGQQFDPFKLEAFEKKKYLERLERGGLGIYIIKTIMDEVEYNVSPGSQNILRMVKYLKKK